MPIETPPRAVEENGHRDTRPRRALRDHLASTELFGVCPACR